MSEKRLFLDIHAIQTVPPSNVNRDDTGSPKTAIYGGARRARVSSQAWKRAMRKYFVEQGGASVGVRSLDIVKYIADKVKEMDNSVGDDKAMNLAKSVLEGAGIKVDTKKNNKVKALFFLGETQARKLTEVALSEDVKKEKARLQEILKENPDVDIALFGRMVADDPSLNEDASCQVAHAISTHAVQTEFDFFTAIDDLSPEDNAGAGMLGTIEFNSSTVYRYANIALHDFYRQLGEDKEAVINAIQLFVKAFTNSMPTGKVNTFANQTLPQAVLLVLRSDRPVNLVTAFEVPVRSQEGFVKESVHQLYREFEKTLKFFEDPKAVLYLNLDDQYADLAEGKSEGNIGALLSDLAEKIDLYL